MGSSLLSPPGLEEGIVSQMPSVLQWVPSLPNLAVLGALFLLIVIFRLACKGKSSRALEDEPPKVAGLPWIGSAVALGVGQASFLHK